MYRSTMGGDNERSQPGIPTAWMAQQQGKGGAPDTASSSSFSAASKDGRQSSAAVGVPERCFRAIEAHSSGVNDVVFDKGGVLLATAGDDSYVKVWDPGSGRQRAVLKVRRRLGFNGRKALCRDFVWAGGGGVDGTEQRV